MLTTLRYIKYGRFPGDLPPRQALTDALTSAGHVVDLYMQPEHDFTPVRASTRWSAVVPTFSWLRSPKWSTLWRNGDGMGFIGKP